MLSAAKTTEYLNRELSDMGKEGSDYVVCYNVLSGKSGKKLRNFYVEMAESDLIKDYVDIFKEAGITLKSLVSAEGNILSLIDKTVNGYFKTFILQIMNGNIVTNILWVDGSFNYYNSVRCFNDVGTGAYYDDCDYLHYSNNNEGRAGFIGYQKEINTTGGTMEETNYAWQTYCDNDYKTYIYHDTGFTKNYCNYDTSEFIGKDKLEPCLEFLNGMFTNGKVILTQHLKIIKQETLLGYFNDPQASSQIAAETSNYGVYTDSETGLTMCRFTLTEGDNGTEAPEDEDLDGIPSGTSYRGSFTMDLTFVNGYLRVDHTINPITYKLDGVDYTKLRDEYTAYQINDEVVVPRPVNADYIPVEDIFDL